jgi:predicted amidohydrolase
MTSTVDPLSNLLWIEQQARFFKSRGVSLIITPENALVCGTREDYHTNAEPFGHGPLQQQIAKLAKELEIWIVIGSMPLKSEQGVTTTTLVFDSLGKCVAHYDKLHLFDVAVNDAHGEYKESNTFTYGQELSVIDSPIGTLGLSICYDLRFPSLYQSLRYQGCNVIIVPAAFTEVTGKAHWETLLKARAIETQCWVIAAAQGGTHEDERITWGHSMIINPWGEIVAGLEQDSGQKHNQQQNGCLIATIDHTMTQDVRNNMPLMQHNRFTNSLIKRDKA